MKGILFLLILPLYVIYMIPNSYAFNDNTTHPHISGRAIDSSQAVLNSYFENTLMLKHGKDSPVEGKMVSEWIQLGAEMEDDPMCRASNHFHNPYLNWTVSGLTDTLPLVDWWCWATSPYTPNEIKSSISWATGYSDRGYIDPSSDISDLNVWDWESARSYYYTYLTGLDPSSGRLIASNEQTRNLYLADTLRATGHVMHLLQDSAVPAHVRNDFSQGHTRYLPYHEPTWNPLKWIGNLFEDYVRFKDGSSWFDDILFYGGFNSFRNSDLWDTNILRPDTTPVELSQVSLSSLGLAEYTSINFLSMFTIFNTEDPDGSLVLPYPKPEHCVIMIENDRQYLASANGHPGETVHKLATVGYLKYYRDLYFPNISSEMLPIGLDENCFEEYAKKLIPRAIGYSAQLLDYFFRGTIEIAPPNDFVYSVIDGSATDQKFEYIKANLRNATPDEAMVDGTLVAVARYKRIINYSPDLSVEIEPDQPKQPNEPLDPLSREGEFSYSVSAQDTTLLQTSAPTEVIFDFTADPIPAGVTDLTLQVVFLGTLGNEVDTAVAVGMVDLTEPTHITFFNSTDEIPNADGSALVPAKNESNPRDFIVAFTGTDPDSSDGVQNKTANFGFYETYDPLIVVEDLAPGGYFRIVTLLDSRQHAYTVMDTGDSAFCPPIWSFKDSDGAVYQEDASGGYTPGVQLKPTYCDTGQPFSHRGIWQHHSLYQYLCSETNCEYLLEQRSNVSETAIVSLSGKINFPNHVIGYTPPTCAEPGGDSGRKMETKLCFP
jgi:hypothetical protein